ncbi:BolA family protein [Methylocystis parvus]|uniref:BolA family transcriptional regulator n=1 Tax=Methylocystis parvus TaxID=134 RepID=A0A6B8M8G2_9HYPH|nr:BolA family protein [Methylocystis parvus]QGM97020.1 BolA family transcriptional regulator [Methylocystis parvus]WBJ99085.1 BolA family transcriptional regulator [Methylocystis parvus OBBP]
MADQGKGPVAASIEKKLIEGLTPISLNVIDESHHHAGHGHAGDKRHGNESHFRVEVVSAAFEGKSRVERHRIVNGLLAQEIAEGVHALAIGAKTPGEG